MSSVSESGPGRSSESPSPPPSGQTQGLPRKNSFNPFIAQVLAKTTAKTRSGNLRPRSETFAQAISSDDEDDAARSAVNGSTCLPSSEYDEHGLSLAADVARAYHTERVARASISAMNAPNIAASLDADTNKLSDARFVQLCMLGVPSDQRRAVWLACSGVDLQVSENKAYFRRLKLRLKQEGDKSVPDIVRRQIEADVSRTIGETIRRDKTSLMRKMKRVCVLYAMHRPETGYAQSFNFIVMSLLVLRFTVEEALWMLDHITTRLFPCSWDKRLTGLRADTEAFAYYFGKSFPALNRFMLANDMTIDIIFSGSAFGTLLLNKMPHESVWCVWDRMFAGGAIEFFNAVLHIMTHVLAKIPTKTVIDQPPVAVQPVKTTKNKFLAKLVPPINMAEVHAAASSSSSPPTSRIEFDVDSSELLTLINSEVRRIVDMPQVLAAKVRQQINPLALEMRRNRLRIAYLTKEEPTKHDRLGSSSTDSDS
jgi:hypothetical protein